MNSDALVVGGFLLALLGMFAHITHVIFFGATTAESWTYFLPFVGWGIQLIGTITDD